MLSISSPDYFSVVGQRLKSTKIYIASAQSSVNQQIQILDSMKTKYESSLDMYGELADKYLKTDMLESSIKLHQFIESQPFVIDATIGFLAKLTQTITNAAIQILSKH